MLAICLINVLFGLSFAQQNESKVSIDTSIKSLSPMEITGNEVKAFLSSTRNQKCYGECLKKVKFIHLKYNNIMNSLPREKKKIHFISVVRPKSLQVVSKFKRHNEKKKNLWSAHV